MRTQDPPPDSGGREARDDQDLLTYGEADARLQEVIADERKRLAELIDCGADPAAITAVEERIAGLVDAAQRNRRGASDETFRSWFGYDRPGRVTPPR